MSWNAVDPDTRAIAEKVCTDKELVALKLWHNGAGYRRIGLLLGISMSTARGRVHRALDKLTKETHEPLDTADRGKPDHPRSQAA